MESTLKVLVSAHIRWYNAEAEYVHRLARGISARGHQVAVWGKAGSPLIERLRADGISVHTDGDPGSLSLPMLARTARFLSELLADQRYDVFNPHRSEGYPVVAAAARRTGAAVVRTRADMRLPRLALINRKIYAAWTDLVITGNELLKQELIIRLGLTPDRVRAIPMGLDPEEVKPGISLEAARKELGLEGKERVVGVMGRLGPVKGHEFVLAAADKVASAFPDVRFLVIYGDIEQGDRFLAALGRSKMKDRFIFAGPRSNPADVMQAAEMGVIPSVGSEAHCRVALQWMSLSRPVIGSRVGVIPEVIDHGVTGYLVQPRYSDTLARCMNNLLADRDLAARMGAAGRARLIDRFGEDRMVEDNLEAYRLAVKIRSKG